MSTTLAATLINWADLWKIVLAALVGGTGVVIVFGLLLLGVSRGKTATRTTTRYGLYTLSGVCGVLVVAVMAVGVYAMTQKPSSAKPKPKPRAAAAVASAGASRQRTARTI
jgi:NADH:ubiquinone oxidoreductase subunit 6 (subunit J)